MNRSKVIAAVVFCLLVALGAGSRLLVEVYEDYPPDLHAIIAASLFAGFYFRSRAAALCVPLLAMLLSDFLIGGYEAPVMAAVYGGLAFPVVWGTLLRDRLTPWRVGGTALGSAIVFFLVSNFAVWMWGTASHGQMSLAHCYVLAIPFFKYEIAGDLLFSAGLFGIYALAHVPQSRSAAIGILEQAG